MPGRALKIIAMPTASETAPPVRPSTFSPTAASIGPRLCCNGSPWKVSCS